MQAFAEQIRQHVAPAGGRKLVVELASGWHDWTTHLSTLGISLTGLAITKPNECVNHAFRFVRREDMAKMRGFEKWGQELEAGRLQIAVKNSQACCNDPQLTILNPSHSPGLCHQGDIGVQSSGDVFLLVKQRIHHRMLSQPPLLHLPSAIASRLPRKPLRQTLPRNDITNSVLQEYRRTASKVRQRPWCLFEAASYLDNLAYCNDCKSAPGLSFVFQYGRVQVAQGWISSAAMAAEIAAFAPSTPKRLRVRLPGGQLELPPLPAPDDEHEIAWRSPERQAGGDLPQNPNRQQGMDLVQPKNEDDSDENVMIGQQGLGLVQPKDEADSDENVMIGEQGMGLVQPEEDSAENVMIGQLIAAGAQQPAGADFKALLG